MPPSEYAWANGERCLDPERENGLDALRLSMTAEGRLVNPAFLFKGLRLAVWRAFCSGLLPAEKARAIVGESQWLGMLRFKCVLTGMATVTWMGFGFESTTSVTATTTTEEEEEEEEEEEGGKVNNKRRKVKEEYCYYIVLCLVVVHFYILIIQQQAAVVLLLNEAAVEKTYRKRVVVQQHTSETLHTNCARRRRNDILT